MAAELISLIKKESCPCCLTEFSLLSKWVLYTCCSHAVCTNCYNQMADERGNSAIKKCVTCRNYPLEIYTIHLSKDQTKLIKFASVTINDKINVKDSKVTNKQ